MLRSDAIVCPTSPIPFITIPPPFDGLVKIFCHHFFVLVDWGGIPGNTGRCLTGEPDLSLCELCLAKRNNPILLSHLRNETVSGIHLSLGLLSSVTVPTSPQGCVHSAGRGFIYNFFHFSGRVTDIFIGKALLAASRS